MAVEYRIDALASRCSLVLLVLLAAACGRRRRCPTRSRSASTAPPKDAAFASDSATSRRCRPPSARGSCRSPTSPSTRATTCRPGWRRRPASRRSRCRPRPASGARCGAPASCTSRSRASRSRSPRSSRRTTRRCSGCSCRSPITTNGTETYVGGRYLDLDRTATGLYDLDFNRAYHPYCVYNPQYDCPYPPRENRLTTPIRSGERLEAASRAPRRLATGSRCSSPRSCSTSMA